MDINGMDINIPGELTGNASSQVDLVEPSSPLSQEQLHTKALESLILSLRRHWETERQICLKKGSRKGLTILN